MPEVIQPQELDIHSIFNKKEAPVEPPIEEEEAAKEPVKKKETVKTVEKEPILDSEGEDEEEVEDVKKEEKPKEKAIDYKSENEKLQKTLKDTQRSFHEDRKKLAAYKKAVEKMKEEGSLLDEEATILLDHAKYEDEPDNNENEPVLIRYGKVWDKELEYMRKYSSNAEDINQHTLAFQHLIQSASQQEREEIFEDLARYEDDEVEFTKQMLEIGRQYNDDIYADIHDAGSIRKLKSKFEEEKQELQKELDKVNKKYNKLKEKHQDYDNEPANLRIPSGAGNVDHKKEATFDIGKIFNSRHQSR